MVMSNEARRNAESGVPAFRSRKIFPASTGDSDAIEFLFAIPVS